VSEQKGTISITLVAAVAQNGVIGSANAMPWHLPSDLKRFRALTIGHPVIMGRKTFESIGRPLPGRVSIVLSGQGGDFGAGTLTAASLSQAIDMARDVALSKNLSDIFILGGGDVYRQAMSIADRMEITHVESSPEGDTVFPPIDPEVWAVTRQAQRQKGDADSCYFRYVSYARRLDSTPLESDKRSHA